MSIEMCGALLSDFDWLPLEARIASRRKVAVDALSHSQRHGAQRSTLGRAAGFSAAINGDVLFSSAVAQTQA